MYAWIFEYMASLHDTIEHEAWHLYTDLHTRELTPADLHADGALIELGLATVPDDADLLDPDLVVTYVDPKVEDEKRRTEIALMSGDDYE